MNGFFPRVGFCKSIVSGITAKGKPNVCNGVKLDDFFRRRKGMPLLEDSSNERGKSKSLWIEAVR